jgi:Yip1 domain
MFDIYTSPTSAFQRLKEKPTWLVPLIIIVVVNMVAAMFTAQYVDWDAQRQKAIDQMRERNMSEADIQKATENMDRIFRSPLVRYGSPLVNGLVTSVVGVLFLALIYNICLPLLGGTGSFVRSLSVTAWAGLAAVPGAVIRIVLVLLKRSAEVSTSLAALFPSVKSGFVVVILSRLDPFAIWQLILAGLGLKVVFDLKGSKSYWLVFSVWGVLTLIFALLGARAVR